MVAVVAAQDDECAMASLRLTLHDCCGYRNNEGRVRKEGVVSSTSVKERVSCRRGGLEFGGRLKVQMLKWKEVQLPNAIRRVLDGAQFSDNVTNGIERGGLTHTTTKRRPSRCVCL